MLQAGNTEEQLLRSAGNAIAGLRGQREGFARWARGFSPGMVYAPPGGGQISIYPDCLAPSDRLIIVSFKFSVSFSELYQASAHFATSS